MKNLILLFVLAMLMASCNSETETSADNLLTEPEVAEMVELVQESLLDGIPLTYMQSLQARANGVEATMYTSGTSFSMFDKSSVVAFTKLINLNPPKTTTTNQIGHLMFLQDGENILLSHVFDNGTEVYMKVDDKETEETYYSILTGQAGEMFTKIKVMSGE